MNGHDLLKAALVGLVACNAGVSLAIALDQGLRIGQKIGQALLVWLVPVIGGLFIGIFMWSQRRAVPPSGYSASPHAGPRHVYMGSHPPGPPGGC